LITFDPVDEEKPRSVRLSKRGVSYEVIEIALVRKANPVGILHE
jgi:hypothetical protein